MKLQNLTIIFVIIIIPVTLILSAYVGSQIDTASLQQSYSTSLMDATHDAVVAFELNSQDNSYSNNSESLRRDLIAAINTFSTSLASGLKIPGANKERIMPYIPAILITLYDGYYIYSPAEYMGMEKVEENGEWVDKLRTNSELKHVLKPYVYYSAKYVKGSNYVVVNYSLDNYITIYGNINGEVISKSGYLESEDFLDNIQPSEQLSEHVAYKANPNDKYAIVSGKGTAPQINFFYDGGRKIYNIDGTNYRINGIDKVEYKVARPNNQDTSADTYKKQAETFNNWLRNDNTGKKVVNLVTPENAVKPDGTKYTEFNGNNMQILKVTNENNPEDPASEFNQHKREIIRQSIQDNLNNAMALYNKHSMALGTNAEFRMPKLTELDWDKILKNVNIVTFMQGLPMGNKVYNDYAIVTSTDNKQYVSPNSLYFIDNDNTYHTIMHVVEKNLNITKGYKSQDFKKVKYEGKNDDGQDAYRYYYRRPEYACYECIVDTGGISEIDWGKLNSASSSIKQAYYTALARERYNLDKVTKVLINYNN